MDDMAEHYLHKYFYKHNIALAELLEKCQKKVPTWLKQETKTVRWWFVDSTDWLGLIDIFIVLRQNIAKYINCQ